MKDGNMWTFAMSDELADDLAFERTAFNSDDDDFDLFRAAVLLGRIEEPQLDPSSTVVAVEELAARVCERIPRDAGWPAPLAALVEVLFHEQGFAGDVEHYDAPKNSYLHCVLQERRGLPIALSVLTCEVAKRSGIRAYGIGFPGHFLVAVHNDLGEAPSELLVIDPFHKGRPVGPPTLERWLEEAVGQRVELSPEHLAAASPTAILTRMLTNLRGSYARRQDALHLGRVLSRLLILRPGDAELYCERALARRDLLDGEGARDDAAHALKLAPLGSPVRERAQRLLALLDEDRRWAN